MLTIDLSDQALLVASHGGGQVYEKKSTFKLFSFKRGCFRHLILASDFQSGFTTVGRPGMACKQYNSPMEMYSEEALEEIMRDGTLK